MDAYDPSLDRILAAAEERQRRERKAVRDWVASNWEGGWSDGLRPMVVTPSGVRLLPRHDGDLITLPLTWQDLEPLRQLRDVYREAFVILYHGIRANDSTLIVPAAPLRSIAQLLGSGLLIRLPEPQRTILTEAFELLTGE